MDGTQQFVQAENIRRYAEKLCTESDPVRQDLLKRLLIEEENKFAFCAAHFDLAQRYLQEGAARVQRQTILIAEAEARGENVVLATAILQNLRATLACFQRFSAEVALELQRNAF